MRWYWQTPFYNVETGNPILPPYSIQITTQDSHSHTGTTSAGGGHITAPLIGLWIISGQERREKRSSIIVFPDLFIEKTREWTIKKSRGKSPGGARRITSLQNWGTMSRRDLPLHTASRPEHWHRLRIAVYSSTLPSATRWSGGRIAPHWR